MRCQILPVSLMLVALVRGQTTQGSIHGRVTESDTKVAVGKVRVRIVNDQANVDRAVETTADGSYTFLLLPPGTYWIRVEAPGATAFQPAEVHDLILPVAGALEQPVELRRVVDTFEQNRLSQLPVPGSDQLIRFYGPDLDLSRVNYVKRWETDVRIAEPSVSAVIDSTSIRDLPFFGRDVFSMLVTQPSVASDSATARSLGLVANGIRPGSSNFLLDGIELNNYLVGGPIAAVPPESVQEYRISTNGFSAEYGRTAGYLANAITRSGGPRWHGLGYLYGKNESLNANDFQSNLNGARRPRLREFQAGYQVGGPVTGLHWKDRLFFASSAEILNSSGEQAQQTFNVPSASFIQSLGFFPPTNPSRTLLKEFPPPASTPLATDPFVGVARLSPAVVVKRPFFLNRLDGVARAWRYHIRLMNARTKQPDFIWSPYPDFVSGLSQSTDGFAGAMTATPTSNSAVEIRVGATRDSIGWDRAHPEISTLVVLQGNPGAQNPILPGSPAAYSYSYNGHATELGGNFSITRGRDVWKFGADWLRRSLRTDLPYAQSGEYSFSSIASFETLADPNGVRFYSSLDRSALSSGSFRLPLFDRQYQYQDTAAYIQQSHYWSPRLVSSVGVRMDHYGAPVNLGSNKDTLVELGEGASFVQRLSDSRLLTGSMAHQPLYDSHPTSVSVRVSFAVDLSRGTANALRTVLRAGYGTFYDRPVENTWLNIANNSFVFPSSGIVVPNGTNLLQGVGAQLAGLSPQPLAQDFPSLTLVQPGLPNGYAQDIFLKFQRQVTTHLFLDTGLQGSLGRHLLTEDVVNRQSLINQKLPEMTYLSSQGISDYYAWATSVNYRTARAFVSVAYTWSHAIDNQSDPLSGNFFNLSFANGSTVTQQRQGFSEQFNSRVDRGNADFDQRHNLTIAAIWNLPGWNGAALPARLTRGWKLAEMAAVRSGLPFTVVDAIAQPAQGAPLLTRRADVVNPNAVWLHPAGAMAGGEMLLNPAAFCRAPACTVDRSSMGNSGRNAFAGPGFFSIDGSLSKTISIPVLGEAGAITVRADAFNLLNHANLNQPDSNLTSSTFGFASFGRQGKSIGFPALSPFQETGRQIQLMLRVEF